MDIDELRVVHDQEQLRPHLVKMLETERITPFPIVKQQRPETCVHKVEVSLSFATIGSLISLISEIEHSEI